MNVVTMSGEIKFQGDVGPRGPKGEKGDKPVVGVDYFTETDRRQMVEEVTEDANSVFNQNVASKTNEFNNNVTSKTTGFNENALSKTNAYNQNVEEKTQAYDKNATTKITEYNNNASTKVSDFNENAQNKTSVYNSNASDKLNAYNTNAIQKETAFDNNAEEQTTTFNSNATTKTNTFNTNASSKTTSFNNNATSKTNAFDTHVADKTTEFNENATAQTNTFNDNVASKTEEFNQNVVDKTEEFDEHAESIEKRLDRLESIQDTAKASGENVYFDNAKNYPLMSLKGEGKSEQITTTGKNIIDLTKLNGDTPIQLKTAGGSASNISSNAFTFKPNGTYGNLYLVFPENYFTENEDIVISAKFLETISGRTSPAGYVISGSDNNSDYTEIARNYQNISYNISKVISLTANVGSYKYIRIRIWGNSTSTSVLSGESVINVSELMVAKGTDATYEPYTNGQPAPNPDYPQEIKTISEASYFGVGKNFFNAHGIRNKPIQVTVDDDSWITATCDNSVGTSTIYLNLYTNNLKIKESTKYAIFTEFKSVSGNGTLLSISTDWKTPPTEGQFRNNYEYVFNTLSNGLIKRGVMVSEADFSLLKETGLRTHLNFKPGESGSITFRISVIEDTTVTAENFVYEPYHESTLPIDLQGNELASVGTVSDKLLIDRKGNVAIEKNVGKVVLDGSEDWKIGDGVTKGYKYLYCTGISETPVSFVTICDKLQSYTKDAMTNAIPITVSTVGLSKTSANNLRVLFEQSYLSDVSTNTKALESFKTWLQENNVTVYYELATPELISLGTISNPEIFKGINNIVVETNLGNMQIEVEYVEDTRKVFEERLANLEQAFVALGGI